MSNTKNNKNLDVEKEKIQNNKKNDNIFNTETMLNFSEIRWNTIIMKDWWIRWIIKVYWLNLDLRNYEEQLIVIEQYKRFLNWLSFPIQIVVRSTFLDLTDYVELMRKKVSQLDNQVLKNQWDNYVKYMDEINSQRGLIYTQEFYITVSYFPLENDTSIVRSPWRKKFLDALDTNDSPDKIVWRYRDFVKNRKHLDTRCNIIIEWLKWLGISCERIELNDIIPLLFKIYNPLSHKEQSSL